MGNNRNRNIAIGTLIAAGIGYVAGILTAPKSGRETRQDIRNASAKTKTEAEKKLKNLHSDLNDGVAAAKKRAGDISQSARAEYEDAIAKAQVAKVKAKEILSAVHEGDADDEDLKKAVKQATNALTNLKKYVKKDVSDSKA